MAFNTNMNNTMAVNRLRRNMSSSTIMELYRSNVLPSNVELADIFLWTKLPSLDFVRVESAVQSINAYSITKGMDATVGNASGEYYNIRQYIRPSLNISIISTSNNRALADATREYALTQGYQELDNRELLTITPSHRAHILKLVSQDPSYVHYIYFSNVVTSTAIVRASARILKDLVPEGKDDLITALINNQSAEYSNLLTEEMTARQEQNYIRYKEQGLASTREKLSKISTARLDAEIQSMRERIASREEELARHYTALQTLNLRRLGILAAPDKAEEINTFVDSIAKNITAIYTNYEQINIRYTTPLLYYNQDEFDILWDSGYFKTALERAVMGAVFKDHTHDIIMDSGFSIDLENSRVHYSSMRDLNEERFREPIGVPNPHHRFFDCWGDNEPAITKAISEGDYITALSQVFAAIAGINFSDTVVLNKFLINTLPREDELPFLRNKETGEMISPNDLLRRINNETNQDDEQRDN